MNNPQNKLINGPVNILRLEGEVDKIKKVIYLFMDFHAPITNQYQCENIFNVDVQTYLTDAFTELNKQEKFVDFFVEVNPSMLTKNSKNQNNYPYFGRQKYIIEIFKLTQKMFIHDSEKNKVGINNLFKKIRVHYMDIRDYFTDPIWKKVFAISDRKSIIVRNGLNPDMIADMINILIEIINHIDLVMKSLSNSKNPAAKVTVIKDLDGVDSQAIEYLSNKIRNKYTDPYIKKTINSFIDKFIDQSKSDIDFIISTINKFKSYVEYLDKNPHNKLLFNKYNKRYNYGVPLYDEINIVYDIVNFSNILDEKMTFSSVKITDLFLLRRFLDKKYITNAIAYTGALHSANYVDILINHFNFRVTNASYSKIKDMSELTAEIKRRDFGGIEELIYPDMFTQCSNLESFPKNFE